MLYVQYLNQNILNSPISRYLFVTHDYVKTFIFMLSKYDILENRKDKHSMFLISASVKSGTKQSLQPRNIRN